MVDGSTVTDQVLARLRALGVRLVVDDFGTGFSALGYLRKLPGDRRQDRPLVRRRPGRQPGGRGDRPGGGGDEPALGLSVVAEGVQTRRSATSCARWASCTARAGCGAARQDPETFARLRRPAAIGRGGALARPRGRPGPPKRSRRGGLPGLGPPPGAHRNRAPTRPAACSDPIPGEPPTPGAGPRPIPGNNLPPAHPTPTPRSRSHAANGAANGTTPTQVRRATRGTPPRQCRFAARIGAPAATDKARVADASARRCQRRGRPATAAPSRPATPGWRRRGSSGQAARRSWLDRPEQDGWGGQHPRTRTRPRRSGTGSAPAKHPARTANANGWTPASNPSTTRHAPNG